MAKEKIEPRYLSATDTCRYISVTPGTLRQMVQNGVMPEPIRVNSKLVRFDKEKIDRYLSRGKKEDEEKNEDDPEQMGY